VKASEIYAKAGARLLTVLGKPPDYVRVVVAPEEDRLYRNEEGLWLALSGPVPDPRSGGGRLAMKNTRRLSVGIVSNESLLDAPGEANAATGYHADLEDAVVDALIDGRPGRAADDLGFTCNHAGGTEARRYSDGQDTTTIQSVLFFEVAYTGELASRRG
jgi:hypothetical protein